MRAIERHRRGPRKARAYRMRGARDVRHPRRLVLAHGCFTSRAQFLQRRQLIASGDGPSTSTELKARLFPEGSTAAAGRVLSRLSVSGPRENTRLNWPEQAAARTLPSGPLNDGSGQRLSKALTAAQYTAGKKPVKSYSRGPEWPYTRPAPITPVATPIPAPDQVRGGTSPVNGGRGSKRKVLRFSSPMLMGEVSRSDGGG